MKAPLSVRVLASVIFAGSLAISAGITIEIVSALDYSLANSQSGSYLTDARDSVLGLIPGILSVFGIVAAMGLFRLRAWARRTMLYLATIPLAIYMMLVILKPAVVFPPDVSGALFTIGDLGYPVTIAFVILLVPISLWVLILLTREPIRHQFR